MSGKSTFVINRIEVIQRELETLKHLLEKPTPSKKIKIEGLWKGVGITDEDVALAKQSLFKGISQFEES